MLRMGTESMPAHRFGPNCTVARGSWPAACSFLRGRGNVLSCGTSMSSQLARRLLPCHRDYLRYLWLAIPKGDGSYSDGAIPPGTVQGTVDPDIRNPLACRLAQFPGCELVVPIRPAPKCMGEENFMSTPNRSRPREVPGSRLPCSFYCASKHSQQNAAEAIRGMVQSSG